MTKEKASISTFEKVLLSHTSKKGIITGVEEIIKENNGNLSVELGDGYRIIDLVVLKLMEYNVLGANEKEAEKFVKKYKKEIIDIIHNDTTENNPIALIVRTRSSSIFLKEILKNVDLSKENVEKQPGLKMLTTTFKMITPSQYHHPSDFIEIITQRFEKEEHLIKFTKELNLAYVISNLFKHKAIEEINLEEFTQITKKDFKSYNSSIENDRNMNSYFKNIVDIGLTYLSVMPKEDKEEFKEKIEKNLFSNLNLINEDSMKLILGETPLIKTLELLNLDTNNIKIKSYYNEFKLNEYKMYKEIYGFIRNLEQIRTDLINEKTTESLISKSIDILNKNSFVKNLEEMKNNGITQELQQYDNLLESINKFFRQYDGGDFIQLKNKNSIDGYFQRRRGLSDFNISLERIYENMQEPVVSRIFQQLEKKLLKNTEFGLIPNIQGINNQILKPIAAIIDLKDIYPNREKVLENIDEKLQDILNGKLIISNGGVLKEANLGIENPKEDIKLLFNPLINTLNTIKEDYQKVFVNSNEKSNKMKP